ncbi:SMI1/KNR4 family protein [Lacticaseibacillus parakribbianus]|uniref:SMI1/KNR4 family protein n=1 Tax=Lacticaseibacillus parakribbianus TaxID=2970927 RepID=UPI0021CB1DEC|nr:SMI1/KNR4 family protein [Lacticaseibacillus parakribbianus]
MINWPATIPALPLPNLPADPRIPRAYFDLIAQGQWPRRFFVTTTEPTSESLTGVSVHAFLAPGPRPLTPLTPDLVPFAQDGSQSFCFDLAHGGVRFVDSEVDQWLTVAPSLEAFVAQLTWQPPQLVAPVSDQAFYHALMVATDAELPALFDLARADKRDYLDWLPFLPTPSARAEAAFALQYMPLTPAQRKLLSAW